MRTDTPPVLLESAARAATTSGPDVISHVEEAGALLLLNVTAAPNNEETLTVQVEAKDEISGSYVPITTFAAQKKGSELQADTLLAFTVAPGAVETTATANHEVQGLPIPKVWRAKVTHSGAGSWTYSLSYQPLSA